MAYTRWSSSNWYIFHHCDSGENKEDQLLSVWGVSAEDCPNYTYEEVKEMIEHPELIENIPGYEKDQQPEILLSCFKEFIEDIDEEYPND